MSNLFFLPQQLHRKLNHHPIKVRLPSFYNYITNNQSSFHNLHIPSLVQATTKRSVDGPHPDFPAPNKTASVSLMLCPLSVLLNFLLACTVTLSHCVSSCHRSETETFLFGSTVWRGHQESHAMGESASYPIRSNLLKYHIIMQRYFEYIVITGKGWYFQWNHQWIYIRYLRKSHTNILRQSLLTYSNSFDRPDLGGSERPESPKWRKKWIYQIAIA